MEEKNSKQFWKKYNKFLRPDEIAVSFLDNGNILLFREKVIISQKEATNRYISNGKNITYSEIGRFKIPQVSHEQMISTLNYNEVLLEQLGNKTIYKSNGKTYSIITMEQLREREKKEIDASNKSFCIDDIFKKYCDKDKDGNIKVKDEGKWLKNIFTNIIDKDTYFNLRLKDFENFEKILKKKYHFTTETIPIYIDKLKKNLEKDYGMDVEDRFIKDMKLELNEPKHLELSKILLSMFIRYCEKKEKFSFIKDESKSEIRQPLIFQKYRLYGGIIGKGSFGKVYRVQDQKGNPFILKIEKRPYKSNIDYIKEHLLCKKKLNHPNVVKCFDTEIVDVQYEQMKKTINESFSMIVIEMGEFSLDNLKGYIPNIRTFALIAFQILSGLYYLNQNGIGHCDIKPKNIILTRDGTVKIIDFGLSIFDKYYTETKKKLNMKCKYGTIPFMSPDIINDDENYYKTDIWAFGMTLYHIHPSYKEFGNIIEYMYESRAVTDFIRPLYNKSRQSESRYNILICEKKTPNGPFVRNQQILTLSGFMSLIKTKRNEILEEKLKMIKIVVKTKTYDFEIFMRLDFDYALVYDKKKLKSAIENIQQKVTRWEKLSPEHLKSKSFGEFLKMIFNHQYIMTKDLFESRFFKKTLPKYKLSDLIESKLKYEDRNLLIQIVSKIVSEILRHKKSQSSQESKIIDPIEIDPIEIDPIEIFKSF